MTCHGSIKKWTVKSCARRSYHVKFVKFTLFEWVKKNLLMFTRHNLTVLTVSAKIIVNLHIGAVVKVKLRRKAMQPLLAMCAKFPVLLETATWLCWTRTDAGDAWIAAVNKLIVTAVLLCSLCQLKWLPDHEGRNWVLETFSFAGRGKVDRCSLRLNCRICGR